MSDSAIARRTGRGWEEWFDPRARGGRRGTATRPRGARDGWDDGTTRVVVGFEAKGEGKSTVALAHERIPDAEEADRMKAYWRARVAALEAGLESIGEADLARSRHIRPGVCNSSYRAVLFGSGDRGLRAQVTRPPRRPTRTMRSDEFINGPRRRPAPRGTADDGPSRMQELLMAGHEAIIVVLVMLVGTVLIWVGSPLAGLFVGSQVQAWTDSLGMALIAAGVTAVAVVLVLGLVLANLDHRHARLREARGLDPNVGALEPVLVIGSGIALAAFGFWFIILQGPSPSLGGMGG